MKVHPRGGLDEVYAEACTDLNCKVNTSLRAFLRSYNDSTPSADLVRPADELSEPPAPHRTSLDLSGNMFGTRGIIPVLQALRRCRDLQHLSLKGAMLEDLTTTKLCECLLPLHKLRSLDLSCNPGLSNGAAIVALTRRLPALTHLDITGTSISTDTANIAQRQVEKRRAPVLPRAAVGEDGQLRAPPNLAFVHGHLLSDPAEYIPEEAMRRIVWQGTKDTGDLPMFQTCPVDSITRHCERTGLRVTLLAFDAFLKDVPEAERCYHRRFADVMRDTERRRQAQEDPDPPMLPALFPDCLPPPASRTLVPAEACTPLDPTASGSLLQHFLQALANSDDEALRAALYPATLSPHGLYSLRFYTEGEWQHCVLDDFLECAARGEHDPRWLADSVVHGRVLWESLLLKFFRLRCRTRTPVSQSAAALHAGLHGGETVTLFLEPEATVYCADAKAPPSPVWYLLSRVCPQMKSFVGLVVARADGEFAAGQAYVVSKAEEFSKGRLLVIDNALATPDEWRGDWGVGSYERQAYVEIVDRLLAGSPAGAVVLSYADLLKNFSCCQASIALPPNQCAAKGSWGGCSAPRPMWRLVLTRPQTVTVFVILPEGAAPQPLAIELYSGETPPPCDADAALTAASDVSVTTFLPFVVMLPQGTHYVTAFRGVGSGPEQQAPPCPFRLLCSTIDGDPVADRMRLERVPEHRQWHRDTVSAVFEASSDLRQCGGEVPQFVLHIDEENERATLRTGIQLSATCEQGYDCDCALTLCTGGGRVHGWVPDVRIFFRSNRNLVDLVLPRGTYVVVPFLYPAGIRGKVSLDVWCEGSHSIRVLPALHRTEVLGRWAHGRGGPCITGNPAARVILSPSRDEPVILEVGASVSSEVSFDVLPYKQFCSLKDDAYQTYAESGDPNLPAAIVSSSIAPISTTLLYTPAPHRLCTYDVVIVAHHYPPGASHACTFAVSQDSTDGHRNRNPQLTLLQ